MLLKLFIIFVWVAVPFIRKYERKSIYNIDSLTSVTYSLLIMKEALHRCYETETTID